MSDAEFLSQKEAAALLGVNAHMLSKAVKHLPDFPRSHPQPGQHGYYRRYRRAELLAWAGGRDVAAQVSAACSLARKGQIDVSAVQFNARIRSFIVGQFDGSTQRQRAAYKKLVARQCRTRARRLVVTIVPDWTQDQRTGEIPQTKIIERLL
jgi:hypothetical protein